MHGQHPQCVALTAPVANGPDPARHSEGMTDAASQGRLHADELLRLLTAGDDDGAERLLIEVSEIRDLVFVGAGLTTVARSEARTLPPAQRAQANTRQLQLGTLRDANRDNPEGLRIWLRRAAEEILLIRAQQAIADRVDADAQERTAARVDAEATGSASASSAAAST
jgi:hypothetical protein